MVNITGLGNTNQKNMNHDDTQTLKSLILTSALERKRSRHFSTFIGNVMNLVPTWASDWCAWMLWDEKVSKHEVKKHHKQTSQKNMNHGDTQTLKSLILVSSLQRKRSCHFSTFIGNVINLLPKWASDWCMLMLWDEKVSKNEVKTHNNKTSLKKH